MAETPGNRLYMIRLACGDGVREPESLEDFAERVRRKTKRKFLPMTLSLLERDKQKWLVEYSETFAKVDPLKRGPAWISHGPAEEVEPEETTEKPNGSAATRRAKGA